MASTHKSARNNARLSAESKGLMAVRLEELCRGRFSQRGLADASGVGLGTVAELFRGEVDPRLGTLLAIVEALDLASVEQLLGPLGTETMLRAQRLSASPT